MPANTCWKCGSDRTGLEDADDDACCPECGQRPSWKPYPKIELEDDSSYAPFIKIFVITLGLLFLGCCLSGWLADLEAYSSSPY